MGIIIQMNNVKHAFPGELSFVKPGTIPTDALGGADVLRDNKGGNTSASLIITNDNEKLLYHVLVDAGIGTLSSLREARLSPKRIDAIFLTHGHMDHIIELPFIGEMFKRLKEYNVIDTAQPIPIPVWSIAEVRDILQVKTYSYVAWSPVRTPKAPLKFLPFEIDDKKIVDVPVYKTVCPLPPACNLRITPVGGVKHDDGVIFVVEYENKKIIFAWDMGKLPWNPDPAKEPNKEGSISDDLKEILGNPDFVFVEANTFEKRETGHICVYDAVRFVQTVCRPDTQCYLVHYSGFEDFFVPAPSCDRTPIYDNERLESEVQKLDKRLKVARPGVEYIL